MKIKSAFLLAVLAYVLSACSIVAPNYSPSFQNVEKVKTLPGKVAVGSFTVQKPELDNVVIRGSTMKAAQGSFASYLKDGISTELTMGDKLGGAGDPELSAVLTDNVLNTGMGGTGDGTISAHFVLTQQKVTLYDKSLTATTTFPSSFVGAIAIPNAVNAYPPMVQKLIETLFGDADFVKAVKVK